jgi:hypothetical protein
MVTTPLLRKNRWRTIVISKWLGKETHDFPTQPAPQDAPDKMTPEKLENAVVAMNSMVNNFKDLTRARVSLTFRPSLQTSGGLKETTYKPMGVQGART